MRVLMVSKACIAAAYREKLVELSRFPGVDLSVIVPPYWRSGNRIQLLERGDASAYSLIVSEVRFNGRFHLHHYTGLRRHMRRIRPDIVHIDEEPYNLATWQIMRHANRAGAKALFFTWQNLLRAYPFPFGSMERYNYRRTDFALAGNAEAVDVLRAKGYTGPAEVIPQFGVDPNLYKPAVVPSLGRPFTIGYAGRLVPEKGVDLLLRAVAALEGEWALRILGDGPKRASLQALASELGITSRTTVLQHVPTTEVPRFLCELDALALPSRTRPNWKEQFGRILVEAMACAVPVVGSHSGEIPNVIGEGGLVFPEGDAHALRHCLTLIRSEPDPRSRWGWPGRQRVLEHYTQARIAARTYQVYRRMLGLSPA